MDIPNRFLCPRSIDLLAYLQLENGWCPLGYLYNRICIWSPFLGQGIPGRTELGQGGIIGEMYDRIWTRKSGTCDCKSCKHKRERVPVVFFPLIHRLQIRLCEDCLQEALDAIAKEK